MAVKARFDGAAWSEWAEDIKKRYDYSLDYYRRECYSEIEFYKYLQFLFAKQCLHLKLHLSVISTITLFGFLISIMTDTSFTLHTVELVDYAKYLINKMSN